MMLTEEQIDCLQELINIAMGQASDKLARYLDSFVHLQVPNIRLIDAASLAERFADSYRGQRVSAVSQGFSGVQLGRGEALLLYREEHVANIGTLLGYAMDDDVSLQEQLTDISTILTTTFLNALSSQLKRPLVYSAPQLLCFGEDNLARRLGALSASWDKALMVDLSYQVTDHAFSCDMILLIPDQAMITIAALLDDILAEY